MRDPEGRRPAAVHAPPRGRVPWRQVDSATFFARAARPGGFSLIELVVVVMILSIIAAIALRRVSGYADQSSANAARQDVSVLQLAIERYRAEHGNYPDAAKFVEQLTAYSDVFGATSNERVAPFIYGPYIRKMPPVPLGPARGSAKVATAPADDVGWVYDPVSGEIAPNE